MSTIAPAPEKGRVREHQPPPPSPGNLAAVPLWRQPLEGMPKSSRQSAAGALAEIRQLPKKIFQTVFRVVPYPIQPGLIRIGNPSSTSPVLVTTNYDLTVRRMRRALNGLDCYLLVAPAAGVDVWCAATGGRFNIDSIISVLKSSRIGQLVKHRRLILPQLSATGINIFELRKRSGWSAVFGPVCAEDIPEYLATRRRTESMIRVSFTIPERLEMATAMWGSLSLRYTLFPCLIFGWRIAPWFILILAGVSVGVGLGCFILPGKTFVQKAGFLGLLGIAGLVATFLFPWHPGYFAVLRWTILIALSSFLAGTAFPSYSPLWPCGYSKLFYGACDLRLAVVDELCIGCKICDLVCPVECFCLTENRKMVFANAEICVGCGACLIQCPTDAIINEVADDHRIQTAHG